MKKKNLAKGGGRALEADVRKGIHLWQSEKKKIAVWSGERTWRALPGGAKERKGNQNCIGSKFRIEGAQNLGIKIQKWNKIGGGGN